MKKNLQEYTLSGQYFAISKMTFFNARNNLGGSSFLHLGIKQQQKRREPTVLNKTAPVANSFLF